MYNVESKELLRLENQRNMITLFSMNETEEETRLCFLRFAKGKVLAEQEQTRNCMYPPKNTCIGSTCQELTTADSCDIVQKDHAFIKAEGIVALHRD